ncbi:MAG: hypothetical protein ACK4RF_12155 [Cyclobacteriaceae bacterium]
MKTFYTLLFACILINAHAQKFSGIESDSLRAMTLKCTDLTLLNEI